MALPPNEEDWPGAKVAAGLRALDVNDDAWAKPLVDEALEALDRGDGTPWRKGEKVKCEALEKIVRK